MQKANEPVTARKWWVMAAVAIGVFLSTIDGSIVNVALPTLARDLKAPFTAVQWVVLAYLLVVVSLMMVAGRLADVCGKKRLYTAGFIIFTVGSLLCGLSPTVMLLVASRVVQAIGASLLMALGAAIVTEVFPPQERGRAMGMIGMMVSIGLVSGPTFGGIILGSFKWHAIFFVNLPLGVVGTLLVLRVVPQRLASSHQPFDFLGAVLLFVALLSFLLAVTLGPHAHFPKPALVVLIAIAIVGFVWFVRAELRTEHPLVDLAIFRNSQLATNVVTGVLVFVASAGLVFLLPFFLQNVQGRPPREAGLLLITGPLMIGITAPISGWLSDIVGTRPLTIFGLCVLVIAYGLVSTLSAKTGTVGYISRVAWVGFGMGIFQSPNNSAIMGSVARDRLGVASGLLSLTRTLGQTTGVALVGALWAALVRWQDKTHAIDAGRASIDAQLKALDWVARVVAVVVGIALSIALAGWIKAKRQTARVNSNP